LCRTLAEAVTDADALVLVTAHSAFRSIRPAEMVALMRTPRLVDTSNFFEATNWENCGFACYQLGRPLRRVAARAVA
jgi:UDP-N-acetyl-D-mannosaminuronic acid dehydrogenase